MPNSNLSLIELENNKQKLSDESKTKLEVLKIIRKNQIDFILETDFLLSHLEDAYAYLYWT